MKGDLLTTTRHLVNGLARAEPIWLKAMEMVPPANFPRSNGKIKRITLPEDAYVRKFFRKHPDSLYHDAIKFNDFDPPPARVFAWRVMELKKEGVDEKQAMSVADIEYREEKTAKKKAYSRMKQIAQLQGKSPPRNPYPSAIKEIQEEEREFVRKRFFDPHTRVYLEKMKQAKAEELSAKNSPPHPPTY